MPSELPMFGTPSRGTLVCVPRQSIFSSAVISDSRLSMRLSAGRFGSLKGYFVCENAGITRRIEVQIRSRWRVFILAQLSHCCAVVQHAGWNRPKPITTKPADLPAHTGDGYERVENSLGSFGLRPVSSLAGFSSRRPAP